MKLVRYNIQYIISGIFSFELNVKKGLGNCHS